MGRGRLEAFSDGVIAILITIMVLELKVPHGADWRALAPLVPVFLTYVLSFVYLGIYWNNHHHLLHTADRVNGRDPVGEPAPALLAVAGPVRDRLDGREPLRHRCRRRSTASSCSAPRSRTRSCRRRSSPRTGRSSKLRGGGRQRHQGQGLVAALRRRDPARVRAPVDLGRALRRRRAHVARPRPPDRGDPQRTRRPRGPSRGGSRARSRGRSTCGCPARRARAIDGVPSGRGGLCGSRDHSVFLLRSVCPSRWRPSTPLMASPCFMHLEAANRRPPRTGSRRRSSGSSSSWARSCW